MDTQQRSNLIFVAIISAVVSTLTTSLLVSSAYPSVPGGSSVFSGVPSLFHSTTTSLAEEERTTIATVKAAQTAVVAVAITANLPRSAAGVPGIGLDPFDGFPFYAPPAPSATSPQVQERQRIGGGSGFFVTADGIIVTNKHVVEASDAAGGANPEFSVVTSEGRTYPAKLLAKDPLLDLAFLKVEKVDGKDFPFLPFADVDAVVPGQTVIAIGNALDEFRNSVTKGVVSGLNRRIIAGDGMGTEVIEEAIQTDAAINPGNSGGPLLDLQGRVIGVNTAVSERGQSLGFALPSGSVKRNLESLQKTGRIMRPFIGVRYVMLDEDYAKEKKLGVSQGALVVRGATRNDPAIAKGSPAEKAGIQEDDVIIEVDGKKLDEEHSLASLLGRHAVGDEVRLKIWREGKERDVTLRLEEYKQ